MDERREFVRLMRAKGVEMPPARRLDLQPPLDPNSDDTDCWTHAARYALANPGSDYCEGICYLPPQFPGQVRVAAHAWVVEDTPFGPTIVEFTRGYEQAFGYLGLPLDTGSLEFKRAEVDGTRYSVFELLIATGLMEITAEGDVR